MVDTNELINKSYKENQPVIIVYTTLEDRKHVTVRCLAYIREILDNRLVFHKFKPFFPSRIIKNGFEIKAVFSAFPESYETVLKIMEIDGDTLYTNIPKGFYESRPIRIEPSPKKPVYLYVLTFGEPTYSLDVVNISEKGIGFLSLRDFPVGAQLGMTIVLPDDFGLIVCYGTIRFKKEERPGFFRYGAELHNHPKDKAIIARYIMNREKEIVELLKKY